MKTGLARLSGRSLDYVRERLGLLCRCSYAEIYRETANVRGICKTRRNKFVSLFALDGSHNVIFVRGKKVFFYRRHGLRLLLLSP